MNWKYCILLLLIFSLCILGSDSVYAGNLTGSWNGSVTGGGTSAQFNSTAGNITVTGEVITTGNARWGPTDPGTPGSAGFSNGSFNTVNFWSNSSVAGHTSLQSTYWWDNSPEAVGTDINSAGDDKGTGYVTFYFSKPVLNPILHIDRIGGDGYLASDFTVTNSAFLTLLNYDLTLTKLSGNNQFNVTSQTIERVPYEFYSSITQNATWGSNSAAAGSVMINGLVTSVTFSWTGTGIESVGHDSFELIWELTDDNTLPSISGTVIPNITKIGNIVTIKATASPDTASVTATIFGRTYNMVKGTGGIWTLKYTVPRVSNGKYKVLLTATDYMGNMRSAITSFTVTSSKIVGVFKPPVVSSGTRRASKRVNGYRKYSYGSKRYSYGHKNYYYGYKSRKRNDNSAFWYGLGIKAKAMGTPPSNPNAPSPPSNPSAPSNLLGQFWNSYLPLSPFTYTAEKSGQAAQKAWKSGNIWDFFDSNFCTIPGYNNLDNMWGGKNIKWVLENFAGIDQKGNMSMGNLLLNLVSIIPIARVASIAGKFLPKAFGAVMKSGAVQALLRNRAVQKILSGANDYLITPLKGLGKDILDKIPKYLRNIKLEDIGKGIKTVSDLINLGPKAWIETIGKGLSKSSWLGQKILSFKIDAFNKFNLWGKVTTKEITNIVSGGVNTVWKGLKGGIDFASGIFADMTPSAVEKWVNFSALRKKVFGGVTNLTNNPIYKKVQGFLGPILKRSAAVRSVYDAAKKIHEYGKNAVQTVYGAINNAPKFARHVFDTANGYVHRATRHVQRFVQGAVRHVRRFFHNAYRHVQRFFHNAYKHVHRFFHNAYRAVHHFVSNVGHVVHNVANAVGGAIHNGINAITNFFHW